MFVGLLGDWFGSVLGLIFRARFGVVFGCFSWQVEGALKSFWDCFQAAFFGCVLGVERCFVLLVFGAILPYFLGCFCSRFSS